jgi:putative FmdB family regulatory protein
VPVYAYCCDACQSEFEKILSLGEHDKAVIVCPKCGSDKTHQRITMFTAVTGKKS